MVTEAGLYGDLGAGDAGSAAAEMVTRNKVCN
jgi:hypothetical protein